MKKTAVKKIDQEFQSTLKKLIDLESIIDRSPVIYAIFRMAENWPLSYISSNIDQWGFTKEDFLSGQITWQQIIHPEDVSRIEGEIIRHMKQGVRNIDQNYRIVDKSGEVRWVEDQNVFILDSSDKIIYLQSTIIDVTDRKKFRPLCRNPKIFTGLFLKIRERPWRSPAPTGPFF
jgi:PAS domain S-box-containing protein